LKGQDGKRGLLTHAGGREIHERIGFLELGDRKKKEQEDITMEGT